MSVLEAQISDIWAENIRQAADGNSPGDSSRAASAGNLWRGGGSQRGGETTANTNNSGDVSARKQHRTCTVCFFQKLDRKVGICGICRELSGRYAFTGVCVQAFWRTGITPVTRRQLKGGGNREIGNSTKNSSTTHTVVCVEIF